MLREVGKIYVRAFRIIFQHPQFLLLSVISTLVSGLNSYLASHVRSLGILSLQCLFSWVSLFIMLAMFVGVPVAFIFMTYRVDGEINPREIFLETRKNFWPYFRQFFAGILLSLVYSLLAFCLIVFSVFMDDAIFMIAFIPIWLLVIGYLNFGSITLGQRILLDGGDGVFKNAMQGLRTLNGDFSFFITLYVVNVLVGTAIFVTPYAIGSAITGVDLFSVSIIPFPVFMKNILSALQTPYVTALNFLMGTFLSPLYVIIPTLAYLRVKNNNLSAYARRRQAPIDY